MTGFAPSKNKIVEVNVNSTISAGSVSFFPTNPQRILYILVPDNINPNHIDALIVAGNSLSGDGIFDGDAVVYRTVFSLSEIKPDTICAVCLLTTGDLFAKKITINGDGTITLRSSNPNYPDRIVSAEDIEICGIKIAIQKF